MPNKSWIICNNQICDHLSDGTKSACVSTCTICVCMCANGRTNPPTPTLPVPSNLRVFAQTLASTCMYVYIYSNSESSNITQTRPRTQPTHARARRTHPERTDAGGFVLRVRQPQHSIHPRAPSKSEQPPASVSQIWPFYCDWILMYPTTKPCVCVRARARHHPNIHASCVQLVHNSAARAAAWVKITRTVHKWRYNQITWPWRAATISISISWHVFLWSSQPAQNPVIKCNGRPRCPSGWSIVRNDDDYDVRYVWIGGCRGGCSVGWPQLIVRTCERLLA